MPFRQPKMGWCFCYSCLFCLLMGMLMFAPKGGGAIYASEVATASDPLISVNAQNEPLGEVLEKLTSETSCIFVIDEQWKDHPVKTVFQNLLLSDGLKRILANLNHVIVYESAQEIKIVIYGETEANRGPFVPRPYTPPDIPVREPEPTTNQQSASDEERPADTDQTETQKEKTEEVNPGKDQ